MQRHFRRSVWLAVASLAILSLAIGTILAHEGRPVGDYSFTVGWLEEPAYEGARNAVSVQIDKVVEGSEEQDGGHSSRAVHAPKVLASLPMEHPVTVPVEGLEGSIQVEVTYVASGAQRILDLLAAFGEPGHYVGHIIPTATGVYEFRVFGTIEGTAIDETFASRGGGGGFDDIRSSAGLQFPEELPEIREIESGVRGALQTAREAQDVALAAQQEGGGSPLAIVALIVGIAGVVFGIGGVFLALRGRQT